MKAKGTMSPKRFVDESLDMLGGIEPSERTRRELDDHASMLGDLRFNTDADDAESTRRIIEMMQLIASTREYQFA